MTVKEMYTVSEKNTTTCFADHVDAAAEKNI